MGGSEVARCRKCCPGQRATCHATCLCDCHWCVTCKANGVRAVGECDTCYRYRRRTGEARPLQLRRRQPRLNWTRHVTATEVNRHRRASWWADYDEVQRGGRAS